MILMLILHIKIILYRLKELDTSKQQILLAQYDDQINLYHNFCDRIKTLLEHILDESAIKVHSITCRVKDRLNYQRKINQKDTHYETLNDVTDIAGLRVITYFSDQVDKVAEIVQREFEIDQQNSIDKRLILDPDRFGYLSLHYVVKLSAPRRQFPEYRSFEHCKAEIQIRSILQHAWAEIEHDLGYKTASTVPRTIRRNFSRLAGLLEVADDEFINIRQSLETYAKDIPSAILSYPEKVTIDKLSLSDFIKRNPLILKLDQAIANNLHYEQLITLQDLILRDVEYLNYFSIQTIAELSELLDRYQHQIIALSHLFAHETDLSEEKDRYLPTGISIFYLCYILASSQANPDRIREYLTKMEIASGEAREALIEDLVHFSQTHLLGH
jgi:putative GTP pyrophosphokinase